MKAKVNSIGSRPLPQYLLHNGDGRGIIPPALVATVQAAGIGRCVFGGAYSRGWR